MIGAHLDSWHSGTGAADNADGAAVALEAMRILKAIGVKPRRTIRMAVWNGEEEGLLGSQAYVTKYLAGDANKANRDNFDVYFNQDPEPDRSTAGILRITRRSSRSSTHGWSLSRISVLAGIFSSRSARPTTSALIVRAYRDSMPCRITTSTTRASITRTWTHLNASASRTSKNVRSCSRHSPITPRCARKRSRRILRRRPAAQTRGRSSVAPGRRVFQRAMSAAAA